MLREQLTDYIGALRKKVWIVILSLALSLIISSIVSFFIIKPEYQAFCTLIIGSPKGYQETIEYDDVLLNQKLVSTYREIAKSRTVSREVIKKLGLNISYESFREKINIIQVEDTGIIKIESRFQNPKTAAKLADAVAEAFMKYMAVIMKVENMQIIDKAEIPQNRLKPVPALYISAAAVLGLMLGLMIVFLAEYLDNTIKTSDDITKHLGLPVIGIIP